MLRLPDHERSPQDVARTLIDTPAGRVPVSAFATVEETDGPNPIGREDGRRHITDYANTDDDGMGRVIEGVRAVIDETALPAGHSSAWRASSRPRSRRRGYRRPVGGVAGDDVPGALQPLPVGGAGRHHHGQHPAGAGRQRGGDVDRGREPFGGVDGGFITLAGGATRNAILKISHCVNLCRFEVERFGQAMIVRGSLQRLTPPVLMKALVAAFALTPPLQAADAPGKEMLHPLTGVIFGGLVSSTLLDTLPTPVLFRRFGERDTKRLVQSEPDAPQGSTATREAH